MNTNTLARAALEAFPDGCTVSEFMEFRRQFINREKGLNSKPYDKDKFETTGRKRSGEKWEPKLRYVKDKHGIPAINQGQNRNERRRSASLYRRGFTDQTTGVFYRGTRSKNREALRSRGLKVFNYGR